MDSAQPILPEPRGVKKQMFMGSLGLWHNCRCKSASQWMVRPR